MSKAIFNVLCILPNASSLISGVAFAWSEDPPGMLAEGLTAEQAAKFGGIEGFQILDGKPAKTETTAERKTREAREALIDKAKAAEEAAVDAESAAVAARKVATAAEEASKEAAPEAAEAATADALKAIEAAEQAESAALTARAAAEVAKAAAE